MASSGKKGKSKKGVTIAWNDFVADAEQKSATYTAPNSRSAPRKSANWADETEDDDPRKDKVVLPSGPRATWGLDLDEKKVPTSPPFLAYISNLPYEVEEEEIEEFFKDLKIVNVRLPRDERGDENRGRLRGFGYVEFETRESLIEALSLPDTTIKTRRIRIEVAAENDRRRGRDGSMRSDRFSNYDAERSAGDWRAGPREGPLGETDKDRGRGSGFITRDRDPGFMTRDRDPGFMTRDRDPGFMTRDRDPGFMTRDRDGGGFDRSAPRRDFGSGGFREGFDRDRDRDRGSGFREGGREGFGDRDRDRGGSWFSDRDDRDRGRSFGDRESFGDRDRGRFGDRDRDGGFGPPRRDFGRDGFRSEGRDDLPPVDKGEPRSRPRLNLQPRTKPVEEVAAPATAAAAAAPAAPATSAATAAPPSGAPASIFGGAKPVDTAAREREIEERLAKERGADAPRSERSNDRSRDRDGSRGPPKHSESGRENFWSQRSRQNGPPDNGHASPHSDHSDHEVRQDRDDSQRRYRSRPESPEGDSRSGDSQYEGQSTSQPSNYERDDLGPREDRGRSGRPRPGPPDVRGSSSSSSTGVPERSLRTDRERPKSRGDSQPQELESREDKDEVNMPKYCEQEAPNFAGSNKFAYLHSDEEDQD